MTMQPRDTGSPTELTRGSIFFMLEQADDYRDKTGNWPDPGNWQSVLHDFIQNPPDRDAFDTRVTDGWNTPLHCAIVGNGKTSEFHCVSFGPNRADDHEQGDDIVGVVRDGFLGIVHGDSEQK
jgi:hypothetical protein